MKKLILVANDAPQSGKTTFVRVLEQVYERKGVDTASIYTSAAAAPDETAFWDLEEYPEPKHLLRSLDAKDAVVLAVATGQAGIIADLFNEYDVIDSILEFDAELCVAIPINGTESAANGAALLGETFADNADYLLLAAPFAPEDEAEIDWEGSYGERVMNYLGAAYVPVPEFDPGMAAELANHGMDLSTSLTRRKELPRFLRDAVHSWELAFADQFEALNEQLMPESTGTRSAYDSSAVDY